MNTQRSSAIKAIGHIVYLYGIIRITLAALNMILIPTVRFRYAGESTSRLYNMMFLGAGLGLIFSICYIISGKGILKLKKQSPILLIAILSIQRLFDIFYGFCCVRYSATEFFVGLGLFTSGLNLVIPFISFSPIYFLFLLANIAILILTIYFFARPKVKEQFR